MTGRPWGHSGGFASRVAAWRRREPAAGLSMATRLAAIALAIVLISLAVVSTVGIRDGRDLANAVNERRITNVGASRAGQVERYMEGLRQQVGLLALSPATATSIEAFEEALLEESATPAQRVAVQNYYESVVVPELLEVRRTPIGVSDLVPTGSMALAIQARHVIGKEFAADVTVAASVDAAAADDSAPANEPAAEDVTVPPWDRVDATRHPVYRDIAAAAGFDDLYLVTDRSDVVVYSVNKDIDVATSLDVGPHSGSTLAGVVQRAMRGERGTIVTADFAEYTPAGQRPMMFMASAVRDGDDVVGAVVARIDTSGINSIMTSDGDWSGLGTTGETYLVGADDTMRSDARAFVESPSDFVQRLAERPSTSEDDLRSIRELGTTVLFQPINGDALRRARSGETGSIETVNYLGVDVLSSYRPVDVAGVEWVVVTDIAETELAEPVVAYARDLLVAIAVILVVVTFAIVFWSRRVVEPLRRIAARLRVTRRGAVPPGVLAPTDGEERRSPAVEAAPAPAHPPLEFEELARDIDQILAEWAARRAAIEERSDERRALLARFLPSGIVARVEAGEQDVVDQIAQATVVTVVVHGLGQVVESSDGAAAASRSRQIVDRIVDDGDDLAARFGLDRVKLTGDSYTAICGSTKPYLDHASRSVSFALAAADAIDDVAAEFGVELAFGIGVQSGPVTLGLTGGSSLVYDAWGSTVSTSADLARMAQDRTVVVTSAVRTQLPDTFRLVDLDAPTGAEDRGEPESASTGLARVVGVLVDEETGS